MKTKLLFSAALLAATVGAQAVPNTGSSMLVQLLESQRLENNVEVLAEGEETSVDVPTPLAFYDFEEESDAVELKKDGNGTAPCSVPMSETEKGLNFVTADNSNMGYVQISNPFKDNSNIETQGATISLWVYFNSLNGRSVWGFGQGASGYENYPKLSLGADSYIVYNMGANDTWIDFNRGGANPFSAGKMTMITMAFNTDSYSLYLNGGAVTYNTTGNGPAGLENLLAGLLTNMKDFPYFYLGKGGFDGTFDGKADKLGFYDKALTADEVKALYDSQKVDYDIEDVTSAYLKNADFSGEDAMANWDYTAAPNRTDFGMPYYNDNAVANISQEVTVPAGIYNVSVQANNGIGGRTNFYVNTSTDSYTVGLYEIMGWADDGEDKYEKVAGTWASSQENGRFYINYVVVGEDGKLTLGIDKFSGYNNSFLFFDNFRLETADYLGLVSLYASLKATATGLNQDLMPEGLKSRLNSVVSGTEPTTASGYSAACVPLQSCVNVCNYYLANCTGLTDYIATCEADIAGSIGDAAALNSAISAVEGIDWSTVTAAGLQQAYEQLVEAHRAYQSAANPTGDYQFDMTWLLTNPKSTGATTGWYCDVMGGDAGRENTNVGWSSSASYRGDADVAGFIEKWSTNIMSPGEDGNGWLLYQQALLPAGAYKLTALAFTDMPFNATTTGDNPVTGEAVANLSMGFGSTVKVDGEAFDWQEHEKYTGEVPAAENKNQLKLMTIPYFYLGEAATAENPVKLGINIKEGNKADWFGINDMKLYKVAPQAVNLTLDETSTSYSVEPNAYANVTLTRTLKSDAWNTFCVPFDMTAEQLAANGITDVRALETASVEGTSVTLNFSESSLTAVEAGVPYLVKVTDFDGTINVENAVMAAAPGAVTVNGVTMTGNYAADTVPVGAYFISNNAFYYADEASNVALKGFRAYINVDETFEAIGANRLMININGEVTGIEDVLGEEAAEADKLVNVVSLDGMTVKAGVKKAEALDGLQKGIYIVDGKKYVVK